MEQVVDFIVWTPLFLTGDDTLLTAYLGRLLPIFIDMAGGSCNKGMFVTKKTKNYKLKLIKGVLQKERN